MDERLGDVLTIEELAAYLKIPKSTLYKLVREGKIPSQKVGRHWRFRKAAIDHWLENLPTVTKAAQAETQVNGSDLGGER
ncbi:MAG: putative DNA-binding proteinA [Firmicutes bacterium]|nr:putative DNA-binding proteinA [candidate division NPL-UPA2 bacterium]